MLYLMSRNVEEAKEGGGGGGENGVENVNPQMGSQDKVASYGGSLRMSSNDSDEGVRRFKV